MKYLLVIDHIVTGGAERILIDYYHHLKENGHNVTIFVLVGKPGESVWTQGIEVVYGSCNDHENLIKKTGQQISLYFKLKKIVESQNPDVIFSFLEKSNLLTLATPSHAKKVVSVHNVLSIQYTKIKKKVIRDMVYFLIRRAYNQCPNIIAVSQQVKKDLINSLKIKPEHITVINNYVDDKKIQEKSKEDTETFRFDDSKKYIVNIGRFSEQKAQWKLIKAFFISQACKKDWELIIMGNGEYKDQLLNLVSDLNIKDKIHILPFQSNPYPYIKKAQLFVLSSLFEGFPIVLAEASSLRTPFIGSEKSIPEEMFDNWDFWKNCIFHNENLKSDFSKMISKDDRALACLIDKFTSDEKLRYDILKHTEEWESHNNKKSQFHLYDNMTIQ